MSTGTSLTSLLHDRYNPDDPDDTEALSVTVIVPRRNPDNAGLTLPPVLCLTCQNVCEIGDNNQLISLCQHVRELDLGDNKLCDWSDVLTLLDAMPRLEFLNVSGNPLSNRSALARRVSDETTSDKHGCLTKLVLNNIASLVWEDVWLILGIVKTVEELHLSMNRLSCVNLPADGSVYPNVKELYVNKTGISEWSDIQAIGQCFTQLQRLVMMHNHIQMLCADTEACQQTFPHLTRLNLSYTDIGTWDQLETLRHWPRLIDLRIKDIPITKEHEEAVCRQFVICYLPALQSLNGTPVMPSELEDAHRMFVRHYKEQDIKPDRYSELYAVLGDLDPLADVDLEPQKSVTVPVYYGGKSQLMVLDVDWTLRQLKVHLSKIIGITSKQMTIYHRESECNQGDIRMIYDTRTLLRYRLKEGDELHVDIRD